MKKLLLLLIIPILSFGQNEELCDSIYVDFVGYNSEDNNFEINVSMQYTTPYWFGYCGFMITNNQGDTIAAENIENAANVYGLGNGMIETRYLEIFEANLEFPIVGQIHLVESFFAGNGIIVCSWPFQLNGDEILGCTLSDGTFVNNGWSGNGTGDNWCNLCFCEDGTLSCDDIDCGEEGCWEVNEWYCVGCEYFIDECSYIECESNNNWSDVITSNECGLCLVMNTIILDCFCDWPETVIFWEEFDEETCTLYEMCDCQNITVEEEIVYTNKSLLKTIDFLGRETTNKDFQLEIYDDGSVEKKYLIK